MKQRVHFLSLLVLTTVLTATAAACGGSEVVKSVGPPAAAPPAAVAPAHAPRYGSADAAEHALSPKTSGIVYGSADAAEHALSPKTSGIVYGSADSLEAAAAQAPKTWPTNDQLAQAHGNPTFNVPAPEAIPWPSNDQLAKAHGNPTFNEALPKTLLATNDVLSTLTPNERHYVEGIVSLTPEQLAAAFGNIPVHANS
jgi:hypothetical protein